MQVELKRLQKKLGITFIYVTHAQDEALTMSDRIIIFKDGHIEQVGTPQDIYHRPSSLFVADFIGDSNIFSGVVVKKTPNYVTLCLKQHDFVKVRNNCFDLEDASAILVFAKLCNSIIYAAGASIWSINGSFEFNEQVELIRLFSAEIEYSDTIMERIWDELYNY